jgi:hypothetical protein
MHIRTTGSKLYSSAKSDTTLWLPKGVWRILRDIRYTGAFAYNLFISEKVGEKTGKRLPVDKWVIAPGTMPEIITMEIFEQAQTRRSKKASNTGSGKEKKLLAHKLLCGGCGYALTRDRNKKKTCHCSRKEITGNTDCLDGTIDLAVIEKILTSALKALFELQGGLDKKNVKGKGESAELLRVMRDTELKVKSSMNRKTELYDLYCEGNISKDEYLLLRDNEDDLLRQAEAEYAELESRQAGLKPKTCEKLSEYMKGLEFNGVLTKEITDALVSCVLVHTTDRVEIKWRFDNPFMETAIQGKENNEQ